MILSTTLRQKSSHSRFLSRGRIDINESALPSYSTLGSHAGALHTQLLPTHT